MRVFHTGLSSVFLIVLLTVFANQARSDELLVMPFTCSVIDGEPVLTPSDDHGYHIVGRRKQRNFEACSPARPSHCRKWTIHRFNVKCGNKVLPWTSLVAASNDYRRAWLEDNQLVIQMPWRWTLGPDDPCARPDRFDRPRFRMRARFCERRRANSPRPLLRFPAGYAPTFGIDAIFVKEKPKPAAVASSKPQLKTTKTQTPNSRSKEARAEIPPPSRHPEVPHKIIPDSSAPSPTKQETPQKAEKKVATAPPATSPPQMATPSVPEKPISPIGPGSLTIINSSANPPITKPTTAPQQPPSQQPQKSATGEKETIKLVVAGTKVKKPTEQTALPHNNSHPSELAGSLNNPMGIFLAIITVLGISLMTGWVIIRRKNSSSTSTISRDIASVSIRDAKLPANTEKNNAAPNGSQNGQEPPPSQNAEPQTPATITTIKFGDTIPKTRKEAFEVLGMSVTSNASPVAIKKVVDGLRLSWHPDHAAGEEDRKNRESRIKQINAAWEIISGQREAEPEPTPPVHAEKQGDEAQTTESTT